MTKQLVRKKFGAITVRHAGSNLMKLVESERLIAGEPIIIEHENRVRRSNKKPYYGKAVWVVRKGKMGSLGTAEFREFVPGEVSKHIEILSEIARTRGMGEVKNRLAGIKRMIIFSGIESNVEGIGVATALTRRREKLARMRGVDAVVCKVASEKMRSILHKEKWTRMNYIWWIKFLK